MLAPAVSQAATNLSSWVYPGDSGRLIQRPDALGNRVLDYSGVGYQGGTVPLPDVPVKVTISPLPGDNVANLQNAINQVSALPLDANGFRGAVFLNAGEYPLGSTVKISASGVVLRGAGSGTDGTVLRATATNQYTLLSISGSGSASTVSGTTHNITNAYVPVGARSFYVDSISGLAVGNHVFVRRVATSNWLSDLGMDLLCCAPDVNAWTPSGYNIDFDRVITRLEGNHVFVDAPITTAIDARYTNGTIRKFTWSGRISNCGVENLRGISDYASATDENHGWTFVQFNSIENGWARNIVSQWFGYSCVALSSGARFITVTDCQCLDPISIITGGRRYAFVMDDNTMCLVRNCYTRLDRHQFVTQSLTTGPNVFVDGLSDSAQSDAGPHHRWGTGALWDCVTVNGNNLNIQNRGNLGSGHGWAGANEVAWNCDADGFVVQNPPTARNWLIGSIGPIQNGTVYVGPHAPGTYDSHGSNVFPNSLYYAQLQERLAAPGVQTFDHWLGDMDAFTNNAGPTVLPVDPAWRTAVQAAAGTAPLDGFDVVAGGHWVPFTFNFALGANERIVGATLAVCLLSTGTSSSNDVLYLDSISNGFTLDSLGWLPVSTSIANPTVRVLDLGSQLSLLGDGKLNVALQNDLGVDWALLELKIATNFTAITNTLPATADAFVRAGTYAGSNYGSSPVLTLKEDTASDNRRKAYLRWDLSGVSGRLLQAKVRLVPLSVGTNNLEQGATLADSSNWSESGLTWNNQPGGGKRFATWLPAVGVPVEFPVTPAVQQALGRDGQFSLQLYSLRAVGGPGIADYASRENTDLGSQPRLTLLFDGLKWNGNLGGTWNTNTANWLTLSSGASTTYRETTLPGDSVLLDDSAVGTTVLLLTNTLSPSGLTVNNSARSYTLTGPGRLASPGSLTKQGPGLLTLSNTGSNCFGALSLEAGRVTLGGTVSTRSCAFYSAFGVQAALNVLGGTLAVNNDVTAGSGQDNVSLDRSTLQLGGIAGSPSAPLASLALTNSAVAVQASGSGPSVSVNTLVTGPGTNWLSITSVSGLRGYPAQLPLLSYAGSIAGAGYNFALANVPAGTTAYLSNNAVNGSVDLVVLGAADPGGPRWSGEVNGDWDIGGTMNWRGLLSGAPLAYHEGDAVRFDDSAAGTTAVNLTTAISPGALVLSNSARAYSFTGSGSISGATGLLKQGAGTLTLSNTGSNSFTGSINISGGSLTLSGGSDRLPRAAALVLADVPGAALNLNNQNQTLGSVSGGGLSGGNITLGSGTLTVSGGASSTFSGLLAGSGGLVLSGGSALALTRANTYSGSTTISDGALRLTHGSALGSTAGGTTINNTAGARLELAGAINVPEPLTIACKGSALNGVPAVLNVSGTNLLSGSIKGNTGGSDWTFQSDSGLLVVSGDFTNTATTNVRNVKLRGDADGEWSGSLANGNGSTTAVWKDGAGTWTLSGNNSYQGATTVNDGTVRVGNGGTRGNLGGGDIANNGSLVFQHSDSIILTNAVTGSGSVSQNGFGILALAAANTYSGGTFINSGVLQAQNLSGSATGPGLVTVNPGGTLAGNGVVGGPVRLLAGATLSAGSGVGVLSTGSQTWSPGAVWLCDFSAASGTPGTNWDLVQINGGLGLPASSSGPIQLRPRGAAMAGFNPDSSYTWTFASVSAGLTNFTPSVFQCDATAFSNNLAGGYFLVRTGAATLDLVFSNNHPPTAGTLLCTRAPGAALQLSVSNLLADVTSDPDGDARELLSVSGGTNGASLTVSNGFIVYMPANSLPDQFQFRIRDVRTNPPVQYRPGDTVRTATGTVLVQVTSDPGFRLLSLAATGTNTNVLRFSGLAGQWYAVQFATNLSAPVAWLELLRTNAGLDGRFTVTDDRATNPVRVYRAIRP